MYMLIIISLLNAGDPSVRIEKFKSKQECIGHAKATNKAKWLHSFCVERLEK